MVLPLVVSVLLAQDGGLPLPEILRRLGDEAAARENAGSCAYHEVTVVEELGADGGVLGSEERTYEGVLKGIEVTQRDRKSVKSSGAALADLLVEPKDAKGRKPAKSPFLPSMRPQFQFALREGPSPGLLTVTLEPLKPDVERPRGEVWVRASDGRIEELRVSPSKVPLLLSSLSLRLKFTDTPCGRIATEIDTAGEGRALIAETKFRSHTVTTQHRRQ